MVGEGGGGGRCSHTRSTGSYGPSSSTAQFCSAPLQATVNVLMEEKDVCSALWYSKQKYNFS